MAFNFNGVTNGWLDGGDNLATELATSDALSFSCIYDRTTGSERHCLGSRWSGVSNSRQWLIEVNASNQVQSYISTNGTSNSNATSTGTISTGTPTTIGYTYSGSGTSIYNYINGSQDGSNTSADATIHDPAAGTLALGAFNDGVNGALECDGKLCEVGLWNRALSAGEMAAVHAIGTPLAVPNGLLAYWPLGRNGNDLIGKVTVTEWTPTANDWTDNPRTGHLSAQILQFPPGVVAPAGTVPLLSHPHRHTNLGFG